MTELIAIDFETANEDRGSPCAVGYAIFDERGVSDSGAFLIRPPEFRFDDFNISIHGITPKMCKNAPPWPSALGQLLEIVGDRTIVAHYAPFDIGVLRDACGYSEIPCPDLRFICTRQIARLVWPELGSYSLPDVVHVCGLGTFVHHDAQADATAAAGIAITAARISNSTTFDELLERYRIVTGTLRAGTYTGSNGTYLGSHVSHRIPRTPTEGAVLDEDHPFFGKKVIFTGGLMSMIRDHAQQAVMDVGGRPVTTVGKSSNYMVVGGEFHGLLQGHQSSKLEKALALRKEGSAIELLDEIEFLALLRGGS
jgi:DNA polymerase III epsilon subunit-like protein